MNIFKQFIKSIYSPKDISTFRNQGMGKTFVYIFFLSVLSVLPLFINFVQNFNNIYDDAVRIINEEVPDFSIQDGKLHTDINEPVIIEESGNSTFIIDSTGQTTVDDVESNYDDTLAFLEYDVVINLNNQTQTISYQQLGLEEMGRTEMQQFLDFVGSVKSVIYAFSFILFYLIQVAGQIISITILALIGLILKNALKLNINYGHLWKLSTYAITLPTVFFMIMHFFHAIVPFASLINWTVMIIMLHLTMKEIPKTDID
ncbi:DUF1189 domain-containing protein [Caldifermentibacillus hisashii]|jgi:hypothetical protein|uniref:DUF1189 domain-containing protein n=1 Tax=Bacillaceae TaxID=186817 RepID=UPI001374FB5B|nr:DUF1189 domain-containing protein [Caldibacillus thermoamylovorans]